MFKILYKSKLKINFSHLSKNTRTPFYSIWYFFFSNFLWGKWWIYKACISKLVCSSLLAEDGAMPLPAELISWTGGGLTTVIGITTSSESRPFISRCSWHKAHQCMVQCTAQGSHGEFCTITKNGRKKKLTVSKRVVPKGPLIADYWWIRLK